VSTSAKFVRVSKASERTLFGSVVAAVKRNIVSRYLLSSSGDN
jgi:hypothetical protein